MEICLPDCVSTTTNTGSGIRPAMAHREACSKVGFESDGRDKRLSKDITMPQAQFTSAGKSSTSSSVRYSPCGCGRPNHSAGTCGCSTLPAFERPRYFCGQLLSDVDLTLQQTYFR